MASSDEVRRAILGAVGDMKPKQEKALTTFNVTGSGNAVGEGNVVITGDISINPVTRPRVVVKTGDGTIDAAQKAEILRLLDEWVAARAAVRRGEMTIPGSRKAFNNAFGLNSYHELPAEEFGNARAWIQRQIAIIGSMRCAPKKMPNWRNKVIASIKARCKNQLGNPDVYKPYIERKFGKESLTQLTDDELQTTKQYVFGKD